MRRSKSYEVRDPMNIWNKYDFAMSGLGKKSKILAKIKHFFKCVKWSKQRITRIETNGRVQKGTGRG